MWGCDLTPLFEADGSRLMFFTAFWPLGWRLRTATRPPGLVGDGELIEVEMVEARQEADQPLGVGLGAWATEAGDPSRRPPEGRVLGGQWAGAQLAGCHAGSAGDAHEEGDEM